MHDGRMWDRVSGPDLCPGNYKRYLLNKKVFESSLFKAACIRVEIEPTKRQASKFYRKKGIAYLRCNRQSK